MGSAIWDTVVGQTLAEFGQRIAAYLPNVASALGLLLAGWLAAALLRAVSARLLVALLSLVGRQRWLGRAIDRTSLGESFARLASTVVFWLVITLFAAAAIERLELPLAATLVTALAAYLPRVLVAIAIIFAALLGAQFVRGAVTSAAAAAGLPQAPLLGSATQVLLVFFGLVTGADQLGIQSTLLTVVVAVAVGALLGGATLAFGLGSGPAVTNIISMFYVLKTYRVGQFIRVGDVEGEIVEITQTGVVIAVPEGRMLVPGRRFSDDVSVLITGRRA